MRCQSVFKLWIGTVACAVCAALTSYPCQADDAAPQGTSPTGQVTSAAEPAEALHGDIAKVEIVGHGDSDKKSYRNLIKAMYIFEKNRQMAPEAVMRFKVFPWQDEAAMRGLTLTIRSNTVEKPIEIADDGSFALERDQQALNEDAEVISNRKKFSLAWRADIRTPGLPANTRRLGDLRLECKVDLTGAGADLATGFKPLVYWITAAIVSDPCMVQGVSYGWFADQAVFGITAVSGSRRQTLPSAALHAIHARNIGNSHMDWHDHLRDRFYYLPIWDTTWPDDTLLIFEPMDDDANDRVKDPTQTTAAGLLVPGKTTKAEVVQALRTGTTLPFDSGKDIWVYTFNEGLPSCLESVPVGGSLVTNLLASGKELRILFDQKGVVRRYLLLDITAPL